MVPIATTQFTPSSNSDPSLATPAAPPTSDFTRFLSSVAKSREDSPMRKLFPLEATPGMLSLLAGKPHTGTSPFQSISIQLTPLPGADSGDKLVLQGEDLYHALQYGNTSGIPRFNELLVNMQATVHNRKHDFAISLGVGSQDVINKTLENILDRGDSILVEDPVYAGVLPCMTSLQANIVGVPSDEQGVSATSLRTILTHWSTDPSTSGKPYPKALYTTPTGANPSGTTPSEERKREILHIIREFDILLLEDDAYYFLDFKGLGGDPVTRPRQKTYFNLDGEETAKYVSGRVIRFDTFSKILSGGMRLGFMSAHPTFVAAADKTTTSSNLHTPAVTQAMALSVLEHWTLAGFLEHCDRIATFYKNRRDWFEITAERVLGTNGGKQAAVAEWVTPTAGMFFWLKLRLPPSTPNAGDRGDSFTLISERARKAGVLAVPGGSFSPTGDTSCHVRASYSLLDEDNFEEAFRRLRQVIEYAWTEKGLTVPGA